MNKVLKSFLIGIGWDTTKLEAGDKKIASSLDKVKTGSIGVSAALIGAFGAIAASVVKTADRVDNLAMRTQNLRTGINTVYNFGNAIRLMGGDASEAVEALSKFEEIQNNLRINGTAGPISELARAGIDVSSLYQTGTGEEFLKAISDMLPNLDRGQRAVVQSSLGLSDATFRTIVGGLDNLSQTMDKANNLTGNVDQLTENSRKLKENAATLGLSIEGVSNELAEKFLPSLNSFTSWVNDRFSEYRGGISGAIDAAAENPEATATLLGSSIASVVGGILAKLGLTSVGGVIGKAGAAGVTVSGSAIGARALNSALDESVPGYSEASKGFDNIIKNVFGVERIASPMELLFGGISAADTASPANPGVSAQGATEVQAQSVDNLVEAIQRAKLNVNNSTNITVELDGKALESKITEINGRQNYNSMNEMRTTTER